MPNGRDGLSWPIRLIDLRTASGCSSVILTFTGAFLGLSLFALAGWQLSGDVRWVENFFRVPGAFIMIFLGCSELAISARVMAEFSKGNGLHEAWRMVALSAAFNVAGAMLNQVLAIDTALNPLRYTAAWSASTAAMMRTAGQALGGPFRFVLLAAGLFYVLRVYRQSGLLARLAAVDWVILGLVALYVVTEVRDTALAIRHARQPLPAEVLKWSVDPLLALILGQGLLLYRSVKLMGQGWIGRCWKMMSLGIFLTSLADVCIWANTWGYLPWPWNAVEWYLWIPAAAAFALAPAYQLEAIWQARSAGRLTA